MKKILLLNYEFPPLGGGAAPVSYELALKLSETGNFDIDVVTMGYGDLPTYEEVNKNLRIYRVWSWRGRRELCNAVEQFVYLFTGYLKSARLIRGLKKRDEAYQVCHTHFVIPTGVISFLLKKRFGLDYVITSHGSDIPGYNTDRFKFIHKFTKPFLRVILNNAKEAFAGSHYLAGLGDKINAKNRFSVIRQGVDSLKCVPQQKKRYIFSSGRLLPRKGFQYLIRAVSEEDLGYEVHIAGDGPMLSELRELAGRSKTKIVFHGWLDNRGSEYKNLLEQSSVYVLVSERENASVALLEAMSAGCAIVTSNVSGCPETVGEAGMTVSPRNAEEITGALKKIIGREEEWGAKARQRAVGLYDLTDSVRKYESIFNV